MEEIFAPERPDEVSRLYNLPSSSSLPSFIPSRIHVYTHMCLGSCYCPSACLAHSATHDKQGLEDTAHPPSHTRCQGTYILTCAFLSTSPPVCVSVVVHCLYFSQNVFSGACVLPPGTHPSTPFPLSLSPSLTLHIPIARAPETRPQRSFLLVPPPPALHSIPLPCPFPLSPLHSRERLRLKNTRGPSPEATL